MSRFLLALVVLVLLLLGGALLGLGLFPPTPAGHLVQTILPNQGFRTQ